LEEENERVNGIPEAIEAEELPLVRGEANLVDCLQKKMVSSRAKGSRASVARMYRAD
jgi:hypothetical protein